MSAARPATEPSAKSRQIAFDPRLAAAVAERVAIGVDVRIIAMQLANFADPDVVSAYAEDAKRNPYFLGAMAVADLLRKRDWVLDCQAESWSLGPESDHVPRRDRLAPDTFLAEHYAVQRPAVLTGLVDHWPALSLWTADYLEEKVGRTTMITAQRGRESARNPELEKQRLRTRMPFGELADALRSGATSNDLYVTANNGSDNRAAFDPLWEDFSAIPGYTAPEVGNDGYLWIGPAGTLTPFHHDLTNNLLIQVKGRKRVHMVPNWEQRRMRPRQKVFSDWTLEALQAEGKRAPAILETEIGPGDALFIPVGWWHHVVSLEESYSVLLTNFAWPNRFTNAFMTG